MGFPPGLVFAVGTVTRGSRVLEVRAGRRQQWRKQRDQLEPADLGFIRFWQKFPQQPFDFESQQGVWTFTGIDSEGNESRIDAVALDQNLTMPFVDDITVHRHDGLGIAIGWTTPKYAPEFDICLEIVYRVRLLHDIDNQAYRSDPIPHQGDEIVHSHMVPAEALEDAANPDDLWVRVEAQCSDSNEPNIEARSNTFARLSDF
ncbi:MAG: hypothetical protein R3C97_15875 [Geminicoccaceae bacterium]